MSAYDPQQTSDEPKLGAEFRLGMNGLFSQCCRLCLRSWRFSGTDRQAHNSDGTCDQPGSFLSVPYSAEYNFLRKE
jgi:hypothetical protein